jgi:hypothetical protein
MLLVLWRMSGIDARRVTSSAPIGWQPGQQAEPTLTMGDIHKTVSEGGLELLSGGQHLGASAVINSLVRRGFHPLPSL